jgi:P27 family predicted phage terminase small subunit
MGRRGPAPGPTAIKRAKGVRSDRINPCEPVPEGRPPRCPSDLSPEAQRVWRRLAPDLYRRGVLTAWDVDLFAFFCDLVVETWQARAFLTGGLLVKGRRDGVITHPAWKIYRDGIIELRGLAREFGLTPSARSMIQILGPPEPSPDGGDSDLNGIGDA